MQGRKECSQPFRKVVDGDRECSKQAHAQKLSLVPTMVVDAVSHLLASLSDSIEIRQGGGGVVEGCDLLFRMCLMGIRGRWYQVIDDADQKHAAKEGCRIDPVPPVFSVSLCQCPDPLVEDFNERNVQHDASREAR